MHIHTYIYTHETCPNMIQHIEVQYSIICTIYIYMYVLKHIAITTYAELSTYQTKPSIGHILRIVSFLCVFRKFG